MEEDLREANSFNTEFLNRGKVEEIEEDEPSKKDPMQQ